MPNLIDHLTTRILNRAAETKKPCCLYRTEAMAKQKAAEAAEFAGKMHTQGSGDAFYVVFYIEELERWTFCVDINELLRRADAVGGYIAAVSSKFNCFQY